MRPLARLSEYIFASPRWLHWCAGLLFAGIRCRLAYTFLAAGVIKVQSWQTTLALFADEYHVPLLSPTIAAYLGTGIELVLPPLLALGFLTRPTAFALFVFNAVAATSYPDISEAGIKDHVYWGLLLAVLALQGGGWLSLDRLLAAPLLRRFGGKPSAPENSR